MFYFSIWILFQTNHIRARILLEGVTSPIYSAIWYYNPLVISHTYRDMFHNIDHSMSTFIVIYHNIDHSMSTFIVIYHKPKNQCPHLLLYITNRPFHVHIYCYISQIDHSMSIFIVIYHK